MVIEEVKAGRPKEWRTKGDRILEMFSIQLFIFFLYSILFYFSYDCLRFGSLFVSHGYCPSFIIDRSFSSPLPGISSVVYNPNSENLSQ